MTYLQPSPRIGNQWAHDRVLGGLLRRILPGRVLAEVEPSLNALGELTGGELYDLQLRDRLNEPRLIRWSPWGERIDEIETTAAWKRAERIAAEDGIVATAYERAHGAFSRLHQFALAYLYVPASDMFACPLAMTDGAARTLLDSGNSELVDRALPHLTSRDPREFWTSGQWMTETIGGSDVSRSETIARKGDDGVWRLHGTKWFASAPTSQMALTLARPEGGAPGSRGLALFYVETRDPGGRLNEIRVRRLKEKLGTRKLPTAELDLVGTPAVPVCGLENGVRAITPMLNLTRTWNAVSAAAYMRRGIALARDYAERRVAFGAPIARHPLHVDTLAGLQAEFEGAAHLAFRLAELLGRLEAGESTEMEDKLFRLIVPVAKLTTAHQAVAVASECVEAFGGAGYIEDTGLPVLLRDVQVLPIWEGTTNVLSLEALRAVDVAGVEPMREEVERCGALVREPALQEAITSARQGVESATRWLEAAGAMGREAREAGARRFAITVGRSLELALLAGHAQWSLDIESDPRPAAAARRLTHAGGALIPHRSTTDAAILARDEIESPHHAEQH